MKTRRILGLDLTPNTYILVKPDKALPVLPNEASSLPEYSNSNNSVTQTTPPSYDSHNFDDSLPTFEQNHENIGLGRADFIPSDSLLERIMEGNQPTRLANRLENQRNVYLRNLVLNLSNNNTSQLSEID